MLPANHTQRPNLDFWLAVFSPTTHNNWLKQLRAPFIRLGGQCHARAHGTIPRPSHTMLEFNHSLLQAVIAEFMCTYIFIFSICAVALNESTLLLGTDATSGGLVTAFTAIAIIYAFGDTCGAHFNPAVTVAAMVGQRINVLKGCIYIVVQLIASFAAVSSLVGFFSYGAVKKTLVLVPNSRAGSFSALMMEFQLSFILVLIIYATAMGVGMKRRSTETNIEDQTEAGAPADPGKARFAPIAIGVTLGMLTFLGGNVSGGAFNPARATAPAVLAGEWSNLWIYWVGDLAGGAAAAALYTVLFAL